MSTIPDDRLYKLLPAIYRLRDADQGEPLRALLAVMNTQLRRVSDDIAHLYDNWFIETCDEWVVPYIGDLLGVRGQYVFDNDSMSLRPFVANTLKYRRSKGTAAMLEGLARDVTGWPTRAVEFFQLLGTTQYLNHQRAIDLRTPDLRDTNALELLGGPFERTMHFAEVRRISTRGGKYNIGNVGLFVWRLESMPIEKAPAIASLADGPGRFRFSQLGADLRLFNPSRTETDARVVESDMPGPLRARALYDELEAARATLAAGESPSYAYLGADPSFTIYADGAAIPAEQIQVCDLSNWAAALPPAKTFTLPGTPPVTVTTRVAVDPLLGRFAYVSGPLPRTTHVTYFHGFSADLGGGDYARTGTIPDPPGAAKDPSDAVTYEVDLVDPTAAADSGFLNRLNDWEAAGKPDAVFLFRGSTLFDPLTRPDEGIFKVRNFSVPAGKTVILRAAPQTRPVLRLLAPWQLGMAQESTIALDGFLITGEPIVLATTIGPPAPDQELDHTFTIEHCTLVPGNRLDTDGSALSPDATSLESDPTCAGRLNVTLVRSISGRIDLSHGAADFEGELAATDAILDGCGAAAPTVKTGGDTSLTHVTVFGKVATGTLSASETIFDDVVTAVRTQIGCVRFSFVPQGSTTPPAYRCQPALALAGAADADKPQIVTRLKPSYTSRRYGDPGYAQLAADCPTEIATGAEAGREMGAFQMLQQPQRLANLQTSLDEYLRFGLEAGIFLVT